MKTIILKLSAPMQSWGVGSRFETRYTDRYPSKSAIIGMIAASLGISRDNDTDLDKLNSLDFAVRIDQPGSLLRDYHIAAKFKPNGKLERNYQTIRYYLQDAIFLVGLGSDDDQLIDTIVSGLQNPYYQLYLGRRSCPVTADFIYDVMNNGVLDCLTNIEWMASDWYKKMKVKDIDIFFDSHLMDGKKSELKRDRVISFSQSGRRHGFRLISSIKHVVSHQKEEREHDVFRAVGE